MEEYIRPVMEVIGIPKENTIITSCNPYHSCGETDYSCGTDCETDCWGGYHP